MSVSKNTLKIAAAALGLVLAAGSAQAAGLRLAPGQDCAMQFYQTNMSGVLIAKTDAAEPGTYRMRLRRHGRANVVIADVTGSFRGNAAADTDLAQVFLSQRDFVIQGSGPAFVRPYDVLTDDYQMDVRLQTYDARGRLTCRVDHINIFPADALNLAGGLQLSLAAPAVESPRGPRVETRRPVYSLPLVGPRTTGPSRSRNSH